MMFYKINTHLKKNNLLRVALKLTFQLQNEHFK